jgi:hypothetical protein
VGTVKPDERSMRVALVADRYVNPPPGGLDALAVLAPAGWGVMQLPSTGYPPDVVESVLAEVAGQAEEFSRHEYELVLIGDCPGLAEALAAVGLELPDQIIPSSAGQLGEFLATRPEPAAGHRARLAAGPSAGPE